MALPVFELTARLRHPFTTLLRIIVQVAFGAFLRRFNAMPIDEDAAGLIMHVLAACLGILIEVTDSATTGVRLALLVEEDTIHHHTAALLLMRRDSTFPAVIRAVDTDGADEQAVRGIGGPLIQRIAAPLGILEEVTSVTLPRRNAHGHFPDTSELIRDAFAAGPVEVTVLTGFRDVDAHISRPGAANIDHNGVAAVLVSAAEAAFLRWHDALLPNPCAFNIGLLISALAALLRLALRALGRHVPALLPVNVPPTLRSVVAAELGIKRILTLRTVVGTAGLAVVVAHSRNLSVLVNKLAAVIDTGRAVNEGIAILASLGLIQAFPLVVVPFALARHKNTARLSIAEVVLVALPARVWYAEAFLGRYDAPIKVPVLGKPAAKGGEVEAASLGVRGVLIITGLTLVNAFIIIRVTARVSLLFAA